jgi:outer membrane protein assembly factor BamD
MRAFAVIALLTLISTSCRTDFERIRTSGAPEKILVAADEYFEAGDYDKSNTLYELIIPSFRGRSEAEHIAYNFAHGHYLNGSHILSAHYFKSFADTYTSSPRKEQAMYLSALSHYKQSPRFKLDQTDSAKAIEAFQIFVNAYPESDKVGECNDYIDQLRRKMEHKAFDSGKLYYHTRNYSSAIQSLENMLKDYPDSQYDEQARYIIVKASMDWASNSIYSKKEERYRKTVDRCAAYLKKHSADTHSEEVVSIKEKCTTELNNIQNG